MKRGRPREGHDDDAFYMYFRAWKEAKNLGIPALARIVEVDRSYLWRAFMREIRFGKAIRERILRKIGAAPEVQLQLRVDAKQADPTHNGLPGYSSPTSAVEQGFIMLHMLRFYSQAWNELVRVKSKAMFERSYLLQAEAAMRLAWLYCDHDRFNDALKFARESLTSVAAHLCTSINEIERAITEGTHTFSGDDAAAHILRQTFHLEGKILLAQLLNDRKNPQEIWTALTPRIDHALARSVALARHLQLAEGEDLRWQAVYVATRSQQSAQRRAEDFFSESWKQFDRSEIGQAYVMKDRGIACWHADKHDKAQKALQDARSRLSLVADPRALAVTFFTLSSLTGRQSDTNACRDALAAAALNPYGAAADHARTWVGWSTPESVKKYIENLFCGKGTFAAVHQVLRRIAVSRYSQHQNLPLELQSQIASQSEIDIIRKNLSLIKGPLRGYVDEVFAEAKSPSQ